jgi:hypothetical protein
MSAENPTAREFAALAYALAVARGQLSAVDDGQMDKDEVRRILKGTSAANIAAAIGLKEADFAVDWNDWLSPVEQERIKGRV